VPEASDAVSPPSNRHTETDISESPRSATSPRTYYPPTSAYTATRTRHTHTRSHTDVSEPSSEEDGDMDPFETDVNTLLMLDGMPDLHATTEERVRAQQLLRGGLSSRRVASGKALAALERVNIPDLPENEKSAFIACFLVCLVLTSHSLCHLLQRLWGPNARGYQRGPSKATKMQARFRRPLYQKVVRGERHMSVLQRQSAFAAAIPLR